MPGAGSHSGCCFVLEDLPEQGSAGYHTYNLAMVQALARHGRVTLVVCGPRLPGLWFNPWQVMGLPRDRVDIRFINGMTLGGRAFPVSPGAIARQIKYMLMGRHNTHGQLSKVAIGRFLTSRDADRVAAIVRATKCTHVFVDTVFRAGFLKHLSEASCRKVLVAHDVFHARVDNLKSRGLSVSPEVSRAQEAELVAQFDDVLAITAEDAEFFSTVRPGRVQVLNAPSTTAPAAGEPAPPGPAVLYIGSAAAHNVDGLRWFLREVWPTVLQRVPQAQLRVVGSIKDSFSLQEQQAPGLCFFGRVDDLAQVASGCALAVNPVLAGSGMKVKICDYLALGLVCVTSGVGAAGFTQGVDAGVVIVEDEAAGTQDAVVQLMLERDRFEQRYRAALTFSRRYSSSQFDSQVDTVLT